MTRKEHRINSPEFLVDENDQEIARATLPDSKSAVTLDAADFRQLIQSGHWQIAHVLRRAGNPDCVATHVHHKAGVIQHVPIARLIVRAVRGQDVRHVDGDPFNLRRSNLRLMPLAGR